MVLAYGDLGSNDIFDDDLYDLKNEYRFTNESELGCLQGDSVFDDEGGNHEIKITKKDIANCTVDISTDGSLEITSDKLISNSELGVVFGSGDDPASVSVSGEYIMENWRTKATVDTSIKGGVGLSNETVLSCDDISFGVSVQIDKTSSISDFNAACSWKVNESSTYSIQTVDTSDKMQFTCVKKVGTDAEIAGRLTYDTNRRITELSFGGRNPLYGGQSQWLLGSTAAKLLYTKKLSENVEGEFAVSIPVSRGFAGITSGFRLSFS